MKRLKDILIVILLFVATFSLGWWLSDYTKRPVHTPISQIRRPLDKYAIENLSKSYTEGEIVPGVLSLSTTLSENTNYDSRLFEFTFNPDLGKTIKKTTGQINIPTKPGKFPAVLMLRGYVDKEIYKTGLGTSSAAGYFADNGFLTIAPDFLGYAGSSTEDPDIFEARFQTYVTVLSLLASLNQIDSWDGENILIWGHSNGGQIALSVLEITEEKYPTTLWAPVSKPFPYSVLYYTDESEDRGKYLRREIAKFESLYDPDLYSLDMYFESITAPIQLHQGTADDAVPVDWSDKLVKSLEGLEKEITYYKYPGADHNMRPSWDSVAARDLAFFRSNLK